MVDINVRWVVRTDGAHWYVSLSHAVCCGTWIVWYLRRLGRQPHQQARKQLATSQRTRLGVRHNRGIWLRWSYRRTAACWLADRSVGVARDVLWDWRLHCTWCVCLLVVDLRLPRATSVDITRREGSPY